MQKKTKKPIVLRILDPLMWILTLLAIASMVAVLIGGSINANTWVEPAFAVLAAPFVILLNVIIIIYWIIRWNPWAMSLTVLFMLFWIWSVGAFIQFRFWTPKIEPNENLIKIMSYNVNGFMNFDGTGSSLDQILTLIEVEKPDVVCFQDYLLHNNNQLSLITSRLADWPYSSNMFSESLNPELVNCAIYSKFPISAPIPITSQGSTGGAVQVDLYLSKGDTVRLYTCHMQTTAFNLVNHNKSITELMKEDSSEVTARKTVLALSDSFHLRATQADTLSMAIDESPYPTIITGDMNSTPLSYTYRRMLGNLKDAFRTSGNGYGYTYRPMKGLFRIDYIFYDSDRFECVDYRSPKHTMSDHNPIIATLKNKK